MVMDYDDVAIDDNTTIDLSGFNKCSGTTATGVNANVAV